MTFLKLKEGYSIQDLNDPVFIKQIMRDYRKLLLSAFDIYKSLVNYGAISESQERHQTILKWYNDLLNITETLDETPLINVPEEIAKY